MLHEEPFDGLLRNSRRSPRRTVSERHLTGIGKTSLERRTRFTINDRYVMASFSRLISGCHADNAGTKHNHSPCHFKSCGKWPVRHTPAFVPSFHSRNGSRTILKFQANQ